MKEAEHPYEIGKKYVFRGALMIDAGELVAVFPGELVIKNAAWIADTGRWATFLTGKTKPVEVEPYPKDKLVILNRSSIMEAVELDAVFDKQV